MMDVNEMNDIEQGDYAASSEEATPKRRGLGRGLNALFDDGEDSYEVPSSAASSEFQISDGDVAPEGRDQDQGRITKLGVDEISPATDQPRKMFDDNALDDLAASIQRHGVLQPLIVRNQVGGTYELVAGERRWRAAQLAQLHDVPVIVLEDADDAKTYEISMIENLQRENLNPIEEAGGYIHLAQSFQYTQGDIAERVGKSRSHVANMMRLIDLPYDVQEAMADGKISMGHGRALLSADDPSALLGVILAENLSVRETEMLAADAAGREIGNKKSGPSKKSAAAKETRKDVNTLALEQHLSDLLGMSVSIDATSKGGSIKVAFKSLDQLDDVIHRLSGQSPDHSQQMGSPASRLND